jgi:hypothetical protein
MTPAWVTKHRKALLTTLTGLGLIAAGRYAHEGITYNGWQFGWVTILRILLIGIGIVVALSVVGMFTGALSSAAGNGKASLGQGMIFTGLLWVASDKADLDWRAIRWTAVAFMGLVVCALLPRWVWEHSVYVGAALLLGQVIGLFWTDLFTDTPRWARWLPEPKAPVVETKGAYWRDAKQIRKGWDKLMQKIAASTTDGGGKAKMPKLVTDPTVTQRVISMVVEPPPEWNRNSVAKLAGVLTNEWNGVQSQVREETADRMARRRMRIDVAMEPLPTSIPYPADDRDYGVPLGVGLMGDVLRLEVGARGVPHVLVAGQAGSGKSSAMRVMGLGLAARGARVRCIDPKGEGDLEGISTEPTLYRPAEWAEWFDFLWEEQQRRAELKRAGEDPGPPIVTMIDELAQIATKMGARDQKEAEQLAAAHQAYMRLIFIGRGTGLHIISATQQASAQNMGGPNQGTAIRAQHLGRILFGRASENENRAMVLGDRLLTDQDKEKMQEAPPGRAWVSGMTPRDTGLVHCVQFFDVPEMAGAGVPVFDRPTPRTAKPAEDDTPAASGEQDALRYLLADAVHQDGPQPRSVLCDRFGVAVTTAKNVLRKAEREGWVRVESPGGNAKVVVHPAGDWPPPGR